MTIHTGFEIEIEADESKFGKISPSNILRLGTNNIITLAKNTEHITNTALPRIESYHRRRTNFHTTEWRLETDASLCNGAEFISPPECMDVSIKKLFNFFEHIESSGCTTTDRCGLHVNMSDDNKTLNGINLATFITLINQRLLFKLWGYRMQNNQHVRNLQKILKMKKYEITMAYNSKNNIGIKTNDVGNALMNDRYNFVNRRTINGKTYIEIRVIGGKNYHKKIKEIIQTIKHFAKAIEQAKAPQQLHKETYKKMASYVNRNDFSNNKGIFIPKMNAFSLTTEEVFANRIKQLKNIHKYPTEDLISILKEEGIVSDITFDGRGLLKPTNLQEIPQLYRYFNSCISYMYDAVVVTSNKKRKVYINYINYHYIKYIYNNFNKKGCLYVILNKKLKKSYGLHLPENEPKRNLLWILKLMVDLPPDYRKEFVSTLSIVAVDYILKKKIPGIITLAKSRKRFLKTEKTTYVETHCI
jgi:hypothetical protein